MIEFENVSFSYTGQEHGGLHDINLKISDGECVLFCGRSGCGKTTITRLVNGLIPQFYQGELHGRVLVDGQEISNIPMYQIAAKVGSVFQNPRTQFFNVDTDSEIAFGIENEARPPKKLAERVEQTTEDLRIQKLRNRNIFELSGGEKQKIAFASVYAMNPQIYLLDEPSSNLDMTSIQELKEHLRLIKKQGKTILIAEHRLYYLTELADRIVYLEKGEIKGIYTPEEFRQLSEPDREHMGLRAVDLQAVFPPKAHLPAPTPVLELRNVTLRYKKQTILHDIGLSAGRGEVIGVVGHNGAGKTTFSRALCGLHKDCDGQFLWERKPIERKARLKRSYMVMQDVNYELFADSVEAECSFGIRNPDQTLVNATLEELGLTPYRERHPNTLSGGQKQRVAVAVSMICGKDLLVFDAPWVAGTLNTVDYLLICMLPLFCAKLANSIFVDLTSYKNLMISKNKIGGVMNEPEETGSMEPLHTATHEITFDNVDFAYVPGEPVLKHATFTVPDQKLTAIVGDSGSGKSTILNLIAKYYEAMGGTISIGGKPINHVAAERVLEQVSMVDQDVFLFDDTIRDNIRHARPNATNAEIEAACREANCDSFIRKMEKGYDTLTGENGNLLSGGERQRISIARAILKNSPILLLDEATASLDIENELAVKQAIANLLKEKKTVVMIAHTLSIVKNADQILVMGDGRIAESGTHEELLAKGGKYAAMWNAEQKISA